MIWDARSGASYWESPPHVRGDDPTACPALVVNAAVCPSCLGMIRFGHDAFGLFTVIACPTHVGMIRRRVEHQDRKPRLPHGGGDDPVAATLARPARSFAPRPWG